MPSFKLFDGSWWFLTALCILSAGLFNGPLHGQQRVLEFERFTQSHEGEPFDSLHDLIQDKNGYLWLASETGLLRFDGRNIESFGAGKDGLTSEFCWSLYEDHLGYIWVATSYGLNRIDPGSKEIKQFLHDKNNTNSISSNYVTDAIEASDKRIYATTFNGISIISVDRTQIDHWSTNSNVATLSSNKVRTLFEDSRGDLWIAYQDTGISRYRPSNKTITHYHNNPSQNDSLLQNHVRNFAEDIQGNIWVGTWGEGLSRLNKDGKTFQNYPPSTKPGELSGGIIDDLFTDSHGRLWVSVDKGGVYIYDDESDIFIQHKHDTLDNKSLLSDSVREIIEDKTSNLWFLSFPGGLNRYNSQREQFETWRHHPLDKNSLSHSAILSLHRSNNGTIWVGTENGLNTIEPNSRKIEHIPYTLNDPNSLPASAVTALAESPNGDLWIGTWSGGLARMNIIDKKIDSYGYGTSTHQTTGRNIWKMFFDSSDTLWLGTETEGLQKYDAETDTFIVYKHQEGNEKTLSSNYIFDIIEDDDGFLWIGTQQGLNKFNPKTGETVRVKDLPYDKLNLSRIKSLQFSATGELWMSTQSSGIFTWSKNKKLSIINKKSGLPSNTISSLEFDKNGYLWATSLAGLIKIDAKTKQILAIFKESDGLSGNVSNRNASIATPDGVLFFGSSNGLYRFNPNFLNTRYGKPKPAITRINVLGEIVTPTTNKHAKNELILDSDAKLFSLDYANLNFSYANETTFSYMLEGYDRDWIEVYGEGTANYINVPPGRYNFKLKAKNKELTWSNNIAELDIHISQPLWWSFSAKVLYLAITIALVFLIYRIVLLGIVNRTLHSEVMHKTRDLRLAHEGKIEFFTTISHELRTPLNSVIGFSDRLLTRSSCNFDEQTLHCLNIIHRNGMQLNTLINDLLDLSKMEAGKMEINIENIFLKEIIDNSLEDSAEQARSKGLELTAPNDYPMQNLMADPLRLTQIVRNLISNAIKYTATGHILITVGLVRIDGDRYGTIAVIDTGKGISTADQKNSLHDLSRVTSKPNISQVMAPA